MCTEQEVGVCILCARNRKYGCVYCVYGTGSMGVSIVCTEQEVEVH